MIVFGLWNGGSNYSHGDPAKDMERFFSLEHAKEILQKREKHGYYQRMTTYYIGRKNECVLFPNVEGSTIELYSLPDGGKPFARVSFGRRGGVRIDYYQAA